MRRGKIERIEFVRPDQPTLYVPSTKSCAIWPLLFVKSEMAGFALFRPGYELAYADAGEQAAPAGITWDQTSAAVLLPRKFLYGGANTGRPGV